MWCSPYSFGILQLGRSVINWKKIATIKKLNNDEFQYTEQDLESRFDFPFILNLAKKCNVKNFDMSFAELYGVFSNESDFSGAIKRSLKKWKIWSNKFREKIE